MKKLIIASLLLSSPVWAESFSVEMINLSNGQSAGTIEIFSTQYGTVFSPHLSGLAPGLHGFHIHQNPSCDNSEKDGKTVLGGAVGGHYDPMNTGKHGYPWSDNNHLGDLPPLYVDMNGKAGDPVLAPRVKLSDLSGRALMIHAGGDNHSDIPKPLGGGGGRVACGIIK